MQLQRGGSAASRRGAEAVAGPRSYPRPSRPVHGVFVELGDPEQPWTQALHTSRRAHRARVSGERTACMQRASHSSVFAGASVAVATALRNPVLCRLPEMHCVSPRNPLPHHRERVPLPDHLTSIGRHICISHVPLNSVSTVYSHRILDVVSLMYVLGLCAGASVFSRDYLPGVTALVFVARVCLTAR